MTVLQAIEEGSEHLLKKGVESPRLQAELLLAHGLGIPRLNLYLELNRILGEPDIQRMRGLIIRRGAREPLQHIVGSTSFCSYEIDVTRGALIPRPETELLAESAWKFLAELDNRGPTILDFGTGSGCLAIAIANRFPSAQVSALDISAEALILARRNAVKHQLQDRVSFILGNGFLAIDTTIQFDLILSNPPYIPTFEIDSLEMEVRQFDPRIALDGGPDGLEFYRTLAREASSFLKPNGQMALEFGDDQASAISNIFRARGWKDFQILRDYSGRERIFIAHPPEP